MTLNIALAHNQDQRIANDRAAKKTQIEHQTDLYSEGKFDGITEGCDPNPEFWVELAYRNGFLVGLTSYYDNKYQISLTDEPF